MNRNCNSSNKIYQIEHKKNNIGTKIEGYETQKFSIFKFSRGPGVWGDE